ncbi:MAG TPA: hypothetical protein VKY35_01325 [Aliidiomarina sp.]|nr:hypothetical protein [Aliidiomarina sp.]
MSTKSVSLMAEYCGKKRLLKTDKPVVIYRKCGEPEQVAVKIAERAAIW